jgi:hypothetical protein
VARAARIESLLAQVRDEREAKAAPLENRRRAGQARDDNSSA